MLTLLRKAGQAALDVVFPPRCVGCGKFGAFLCPRCADDLTPAVPPRCDACWQPHPRGSLCPRCRDHRPAFSGLRSAYVFRGPARDLVHALKYQQQRALAATAAALLSRYLDENPLPADVITAVPLHPRRQRARGYNQSALIAEELGRLRGLPVGDRLLVRRRNTAAQARAASAEDRRRNVEGAFQFAAASPATGCVLLIDDVATTGATLDSCARVLLENGAAAVWALTFARED